MSRYFFHIMNSRAIIDLDGTEFAGNTEARMHAIAITSTMMSELDSNWKGEEWTMTVTDLEGVIILTLKFSANLGTVH